MTSAASIRSSSLLVIGAHPDDIEFGCGGIVGKEAAAGRRVHFVVCSRGEASSNGTPAQRTREAKTSAEMLGASLEFLALGGDGHLQQTPQNAIKLAGIIRRHRPALLLAPTPMENQHPDHSVAGKLARDAGRLARYGGLKELRKIPAHAIDGLLFYAVTPDAEPRDEMPLLVDISEAKLIATWKRAMEAHASQLKTRAYVELQLTRARLNGLRAGVAYAIPLFPGEPLVLDGLAFLSRTARAF